MNIPGYLNIDNLREKFPKDFTEAQLAAAQTAFLKRLSVETHHFYRGKMITVPKAGLYGFGWFGVYYTPGVSGISTAIRDNHLSSFELSNRGDLVAVISDSTRVLGDGDVSPSGGLGVMEGKAFLMYYLGGMSAIALCVDSHEKMCRDRHDPKAEHDPEKIINFVRMASPSFGAVNLEDISQPNCYKVLDDLQDCGIPVWHDDAQGTACVTLAGLINALKLAGKKIEDAKIVLYGAGASNSTVARLLITDGADPAKIILFDTKGTLHPKREDIKADPRFYRKWELCSKTNPGCVENIEEAMKGADVLIALSKPGPGTVSKEWISAMAEKSIVFTCANPVPEIYPYEAKEAGAYIVATGRSDFPNQVNNSLGFPGILKGALLVRASRVTDNMAIAAAHSLARTAEKNGLRTDYIIPLMNEEGVYPEEAASVAMQAIKDGVARVNLTEKEVYDKALHDIRENRRMVDHLMEHGFIAQPPESLIQKVLDETVEKIRLAQK